MRKKAAMELSVTAIVVLILAIVMLGLGLGFIRGMFGKVSTSFEEQIATEPEPPQASGSDPITLSRESMIVNAGSSTVLKLGVYNPTNDDWNNIKPFLNCSTSSLISSLDLNPKTIKQGESGDFNALLVIGKTTPPSTYLCYALIGNNSNFTYTKDFTIKVVK